MGDSTHHSHYLHLHHIPFQELKLHTFEASCLPELACLLHKLAMALGLTGYCDHYQTNHPALLSRTTPGNVCEDVSTGERMSEQERREGEGEGEGDVPQSPPHILHWLYSLLKGEEVCEYSEQFLWVIG